jgi:RecA/RadA recombinase
MAAPKKSKSAKSSTSSGVSLLDELNNIVSSLDIKESKSYKPVPTGINVLDYYNARYFTNHETKETELFTGMPIGKLIYKVGYTGAGKTTITVQEAMALTAPYETGSVIHIDLENAWSVDRTVDVCGLDIEVVKRKYKRIDPIPLEKIYALVKKIINKKTEMMKDPNSDIWVTDVRTGELIPVPTVIIIDTVAALQSDQVMNENEEIGSLMYEKGQQAGANNAFAQRMAGLIGVPNITIYAVNHIRELINNGQPKPKRVQYLAQDETCPGGTGFSQYADYFLKMVPCESLTNQLGTKMDIPGKIIRCTIVKSRLSYDARQFELVMTDDGFSNAWTNFHFLNKNKLLKGAGAYLFVEAPDGRVTKKFAMKHWANLYETDEEFREIADAKLEEQLLLLVPQPGSAYEQELLEGTHVEVDGDELPLEDDEI